MSVTKSSSSCSGAGTSDMTMTVLEKTINDSGVLLNKVMFHPVSCHDSHSKLSSANFYYICFTRLLCCLVAQPSNFTMRNSCVWLTE